MTATTLRSLAPGDLSFAQVLHADGPDPERADKLALFGWFVGDWEMDIVTFPEGGTAHQGQGEIHVGWVLEGRAIQDVWMIPRLQDRKPGIDQLPGAGNWYGTTLRIYDPVLDAWRILWNDPATNFFSQQMARARGEDIVQEGPDPRGGSMRWTFTEIDRGATAGIASFHWTAEHSEFGGVGRPAPSAEFGGVGRPAPSAIGRPAPSEGASWRKEVDIRARRV